MSDATDRIESDELRRQLARAWEAGYSAGWTDQLCDFPPHTSENPYKHLLRKQQGREAGR